MSWSACAPIAPRCSRVPVFANVGGFTAAELAETANRVAPHADAIELSLICPNIRRDGAPFDALGRLAEVLPRLDVDPARIVLRVPNDVADVPERFAAMIEAADRGRARRAEGGRRQHRARAAPRCRRRHAARGPIRDRALGNVAFAARLARGRIAIKGNGGISCAADVRRMLAAGAVCVDLYTALVYRGWTLARDIARDLAAAGPLPALGAPPQLAAGPPGPGRA
jgi:dihydroorotate dehydrogenase